MDTEEIEFLISQHFDGTLEAADEARLQQALAADPAARALFDEHATLDAALRATKSDVVVDEDLLAEQIAQHLDEVNAKPLRMPRWGLAPLAMAACLLIGLTLGVVFLKDDDKKIASVPTPTLAPVTEIALLNPSPAQSPSDGFANVSVGVPANLTPQIVAALYLSQDMNAARVSIRAAGHRSADAFD